MPIDLIDTIKPKNNGTFPMVEAEDVVVGKGTADEKRLPEALAEAGKVAAVDTAMPGTPADDHVPSTQLLKELLAGYLSLNTTDWQHIKGPISFDYHDNQTASVNITSINGVSSGSGVIEHGRLYINNNTRLDTNDYLNGMRQVYIAGSPAIRKLDGDNLYAPKDTTYTKGEVDGKISEALGDIKTALAAI